MAKHKDNLTADRRQRIGAALGKVPSGLFILTAQDEEHRAAMLCSWVQQVCFEPAMVSVAVAKGRAIMPLISESHRFGLCQIAVGDKSTLRKFAAGHDINDDPFLGLELIDNALHVPILKQTMSYLVCELQSHMDVEGDHDLFVGLIKDGGSKEGEPQVHLRSNGFSY